MTKIGYWCALAITIAILEPGTRKSLAQVAPTQMQPAQRSPTHILPTTVTPVPWSTSVPAQVSYEQRDGIQYQVTRRVVKRQVPVTVIQNQSQTIYKQQVKSRMASRQQTFTVPVTEYKKVSKTHGRWNPFVAPYRTEEFKPVTVWKQQVVTVQVPTSYLASVPETKTVQVPVTAYRTVEEEIFTRVAMSGPLTAPRTQPSTASQRPNGPSATLAALPNDQPGSASALYGPSTMGGIASRSTLSGKGKGWQTIEQGYRR